MTATYVFSRIHNLHLFILYGIDYGISETFHRRSINFISAQEESHSEEASDEGHEGESEDGHAAQSEELDVDPHVWLDPNRSITIAENIKNTLIEISPENMETYESNFNMLKQDLDLISKVSE